MPWRKARWCSAALPPAKAAAGGATVTKNHPTTAQIINGALVEKEIPTQFVRDHTVELLLRDPSFNSASAMAAAINEVFTNSAHAVDSSTVQVQMPDGAETLAGGFHRAAEHDRGHAGHAGAHHHQRAHRHHCRHGGDPHFQLRRGVRQHHHQRRVRRWMCRSPNAVQQHRLHGRHAAHQHQRHGKQIQADPLQELPTVEKVAAALNALGATPRDMMSIFQAMKQAGALQAELITR